MNYARFILYNIVGGIIWVAGFLFAGYLFGQSEIVEHNFTLVILAIIAISLVPPVIEFVRSCRSVSRQHNAHVDGLLVSNVVVCYPLSAASYVLRR